MPVKEEPTTNATRADLAQQPLRNGSKMQPHTQQPASVAPGTVTLQRLSVGDRSSSSESLGHKTPSCAPVPIPRLSVSGNMLNPNQPQPVAANGPMSGHVHLPERAKPGRKPKQQSDETKDVRKEQNRKAQRGFRERKRARIQELEEELQLQRERFEARIRDQQIQHEQSRQDWQRQTEELRKRNEHLERQVQKAVNKIQQFEETEVDFTQAFQRPTAVEIVNSPANDSGVGADDGNCGFCTDSQNCVCHPTRAPAALPAAAPVEPKLRGPGDCDACRADPMKAEACRALAQQTRMYPNFRAQNGETLRELTLPSIDTGDLPPPSKRARISCSQVLDRFSEKGQRLASISELFGSNQFEKMHGYAVSKGGYEVEEEEAAQVLQTLSQQKTAVSSKNK